MEPAILSEVDKAVLTNLCRRICADFGVDKAYFAQILGKRRHYLAGYGEETYKRSEHMELSANIALFWQGSLSNEVRQSLRAELAENLLRIEKELDRSIPNNDTTAPP